MQRRIVIARHAQDDETRRGGWGQQDLVPEGIVQAEALAAWLQGYQPALGINHIVASDLRRAAHTAQIIQKALDVPLSYGEGLREMNNGALAGMPNEEALTRYPGLYASSLEMDEPYPGSGESPRAFMQRIRNTFDRLSSDVEAGSAPLWITHGGAVNILYHLLEGKAWSNRQKAYPAAHASVHVLEHNGKGWHFTLRNKHIYLG